MELGSGRAFITCPIPSSMAEGLRGSWQLLRAVSWYSLTLSFLALLKR